jgi:hypothetical protein
MIPKNAKIPTRVRVAKGEVKTKRNFKNPEPSPSNGKKTNRRAIPAVVTQKSFIKFSLSKDAIGEG